MNEAGTRTLIRKPPRPASDAGRSRLGDFTRPVARAQRIAKNRRPAILLGAIGLVVAGTIGAALFGLPVRTWFSQDTELARLKSQRAELEAVNDELQLEVSSLQTDEGIIQAARETLGYQQVNERRETIVGLPPLPSDLPDGWPYGPAEQIIALRAAALAGQPAGG